MIRHFYHKKSSFLEIGIFLNLPEDPVDIGLISDVSAVCLIFSEFGSVITLLPVT
jgi:hypothetical protein